MLISENQKLQQPNRLLILTSSTGAGHNAAAAAIAEWANYLLGDQIEIKVEHILENSDPSFAKLVDFYNLIQRNAPWFYHFYYNVIQMAGLMSNPISLGIGKNYYVKLLNDFKPQVIISVHGLTNKGYFEIAKKVVGSHLHCVTYCPEMQGGYGFFRSWVNHRCDLF